MSGFSRRICLKEDYNGTPYHSISVFVAVVRHKSGPRGPRAPTTAIASAPIAASLNRATTARVGPGSSSTAVLRVEILLDRAHFSCGQIDGRYSQNLKNAIEAYQSAHQLKVDGVVGRSMWKLLNQDPAEAVIEHRISREDLAGPFVDKIPQDMEAKSKLKGMYYESPLQEFTGKYHASEALLKRLNPRQWFDREGKEILVPNVVTRLGKGGIRGRDGPGHHTPSSQHRLKRRIPAGQGFLLRACQCWRPP